MRGFSIRVVRQPNWSGIAKRLGSSLDDVVSAAAYEVEGDAKRLAPVDTGRLRASIAASKATGGGWQVVAQTDYAAFVEFGTGRRGAATNPRDGTPRSYRHGSTPGTRAQPYLRPALRNVMHGLKRKWR